VSEAVPVLVSVTICGLLVVPDDRPLNVSTRGLIANIGVAVAVATPANFTVVGLPSALWVIDIEPTLSPALVGAKLAMITHDPPTATLLQLFVCRN
jgi:hypothetical protein